MKNNHLCKKQTTKKALIICGPTASGKTDLAHGLALKNNGEIVNADSMQLYKQISVITASPSLMLKNEIPYHLYNFQNIDQEFSVVKYIDNASKIIREILERKKLPIIVGGSGMYINMLINGYSSIPKINNKLKNQAKFLHKKIGADAFFKELVKLDPKVGQILKTRDTQRVIRGYEVVKQTGKSILDFQTQNNIKPLTEIKFEILLLLPERKFLYNACNARFLELIKNGAIEEVKNVYDEYCDLQTSAMKALGISEIISFIKKAITLEKAVELASTKTRQYAKRQITWFSNQIKNKQTIKFANSQEYLGIKNCFLIDDRKV